MQQTPTLTLLSGNQLVRHDCLPGSQKSNQANDLSSNHTKGLQVLTMLTTQSSGEDVWGEHWQQPGNKLLTPLSYFPCWDSSTTGKQRPAIKRKTKEEWHSLGFSNSKTPGYIFRSQWVRKWKPVEWCCNHWEEGEVLFAYNLEETACEWKTG